jgi:low affinity Fe/Cu permease
MKDLFHKFAQKTSRWTGHPASFIAALAIVVIWGASGRVFQFSDTWQLVINTGTTIVTFLMVFLIQNTQNRDATATQLKLDELIRAHGRARNKMIDLEELSDEELDTLHKEFCALKDHYAEKVQHIFDAKQKRHRRRPRRLRRA